MSNPIVLGVLMLSMRDLLEETCAAEEEAGNHDRPYYAGKRWEEQLVAALRLEHAIELRLEGEVRHRLHHEPHTS